MTASLLNSWLYSYSDEGFKDFLEVLNREPTKQSKLMLDGIQFENMVSAWNKGFPVDQTHKWFNCIKTCAYILKDSQEQVKVYKDFKCCDLNFLLYGKLDNLKRGIIYDTKFSTSYRYGKYVNSPQHPMYFTLVPEAGKFIYLVADGKDVYKEEYRNFDYIPIEQYIKPFIKFLTQKKLIDIYFDKWKTKGE